MEHQDFKIDPYHEELLRLLWRAQRRVGRLNTAITRGCYIQRGRHLAYTCLCEKGLEAQLRPLGPHLRPGFKQPD